MMNGATRKKSVSGKTSETMGASLTKAGRDRTVKGNFCRRTEEACLGGMTNSKYPIPSRYDSPTGEIHLVTVDYSQGLLPAGNFL